MKARRFGSGLLTVLAATSAPMLAAGGDHTPLAPVGVHEGMAVEVGYRLGADAEADAITLHLEVDVRARAGDPYGFPAGSWVPGLTVHYELNDPERDLHFTGMLMPMVSQHGPHYGTTVVIQPDVYYRLDLRFEPPVSTGFGRHSDGVTGVPEWWKPFEVSVPVQFDPLAGAAPAEATASSFGDVQLVSQLDVHGSYSDIWGYADASGEFALVGTQTGTSIVDVTEETAPVEVGFIPGPSSIWRDIKTYRNFMYVTTEGAGPGSGLQVVDLSNPRDAQLVNTFDATFTTAHNIYIDTVNALAYICGTSNGLRILALEPNPAAPVDIGGFAQPYVHDAYTDGDTGFFSMINNGTTEIWDVSNPGSPSVLQSRRTPGSAAHNVWADPDQTYLIATDETLGGRVSIWSLPEFEQVSEYKLGGLFSSVHNGYILGDEAYIAYYTEGMRVLNLSRPSAPLEVGGFDTFPGPGFFQGAWGIYPYSPSGLILVSDIQSGLFLFRYVPTQGVVSGIVQTPQGDPIANATVGVLPQGGAPVLGTSNELGEFALYVPPGSGQVGAIGGGFGPAIEPIEVLLGDTVDRVITLGGAAAQRAPEWLQRPSAEQEVAR